MTFACRSLVITALLACVCPTLAQITIRRDLEIDPVPRFLQPPPAAERQANHYAALKLFLRGQCLERDNRLLEAVRAYEDALKLEPGATSIMKALIPLCFNLDRDNQALDYCRKVLEKEPENCDLLFRFGTELHERGELVEAANTLARAVQIKSLRDRPAILAQVGFSLAGIYEELKEYDKAAEAYVIVATVLDNPEKLLPDLDINQRRQIGQEAAKTYERLGRVQLKAKRYDQAAAAFKLAQQRDPSRTARLEFNLAEVYLAKNDLEPARLHLEKYVATQPGGAEAYELLVSVLERLQRPGEIVPTLEKAAAKDPFNQGLRLLLAAQYVRFAQPRKAESLYLASLEEYPSEEAYRGLARLFQQQGRWVDLVTRLNEDLGDPRHLPSARLQIQVLASDSALVKGMASAAMAFPQRGQELGFQTRRVLATLCRQAKLYDAAEHLCRLCLHDDPQPGESYLELCRILGEAGKFDAEAAVCREALAKKLKVPPLTFQLELARALGLAGKDREAIATAQIAVQQSKPDSEEWFQAQYTLAVTYYRAQQHEQAIKECQALLTRVPDGRGRRQTHYLLSSIYSSKRDFPHAEEQLQKVLEIDPEDATACNDLGYIWADQGKNLEEAEQLIRKALTLDRANRQKRQGALEKAPPDQDNAAYIDSLGWVLYRRGKLDEARQELERAVRLAPDEDPVIWDHLGDVYRDLGQAAQAQKAWEKAYQLYGVKRAGQEDRRQALLDKLRFIRAGASGKKQ